MFRSIAISLVAVALAAGCAAPTSADDPAAPSGEESDLTKALSFTCVAQDPTNEDVFKTLVVKGTGTSATISVTTDEEPGTFVGKYDTTYPNSRTSAANQDFRRFKWTTDDPWEDSGVSIMLVHKDLLAGKAGTMKWQVTGEGFENNYMTCTPKK